VGILRLYLDDRPCAKPFNALEDQRPLPPLIAWTNVASSSKTEKTAAADVIRELAWREAIRLPLFTTWVIQPLLGR
jgi:hypothetical protein